MKLYRGVIYACFVGPCPFERIPGCAYCPEHELRWIAAGNEPSRAGWMTEMRSGDYHHWRNAYQDLLDREDPVGSPRALIELKSINQRRLKCEF